MNDSSQSKVLQPPLTDETQRLLEEIKELLSAETISERDLLALSRILTAADVKVTARADYGDGPGPRYHDSYSDKGYNDGPK